MTVFILNTCTTVVYVNFSKNSFQSFLSKRGAKVRIFIFIFQIFSKFFFDLFFFGSFFRNDFRTFAWIFQPHPSASIFPGSSTPLSSCLHRISLDCGCKSTAVKHILQMFSQLFSIYFSLSLIVNDLQMHFSPFFYFPLFLSYFSFPNSQSSILNWQKAGVFLSFRAGFSAKGAGFLSFHTYLLKTNKRESISILTRFSFDSRLSWLVFFYYIPTITIGDFSLYPSHTYSFT